MKTIDSAKGLKVGDTVYVVQENFYHEKGIAGPKLEYCVYSSTIKCFRKGSYIDFIAKIDAPLKNNIYDWKLSDLDKRYIFRSRKNAALFAKELTEKYERSIFYDPQKDLPLKRSWENFINE